MKLLKASFNFLNVLLFDGKFVGANICHNPIISPKFSTRLKNIMEFSEKIIWETSSKSQLCSFKRKSMQYSTAVTCSIAGTGNFKRRFQKSQGFSEFLNIASFGNCASQSNAGMGSQSSLGKRSPENLEKDKEKQKSSDGTLQNHQKTRIQGKKEIPLCYYFTQGLCTHGDDADHLQKFSHTYPDLHIEVTDVDKIQSQPFDHVLILDLEGKVEILEFPVVLIDVRTLKPVDRFHRFVRPVKMSLERQDQYIRGKYGRWNLARVWHNTAIPFTDVLIQFEDWLSSHGLWEKDTSYPLHKAAFVTCGNWDIKTKIPEQCKDSDIPLPAYFREWVNLKDVFYNHYNWKPSGMKAMLEFLRIPLKGSHHLGFDDAHNIAKVLQRMLLHKARIRITAQRTGEEMGDIDFKFKRRVK